MKRIYIIAGVLLILGATFAIEYYTETRFPTRDLVMRGVPKLEIGEKHTFSYMREMYLVGYSDCTVIERDDDTYTVVCSTDVTDDDKRLQLTSIFLFDVQYTPEDYSLTVDHEGEINQINVTFTGSEIVSTITFANETVTLSDDYTERVLLTENNMPGLWELLLLSAELEAGERYTVDAYIPQGGAVFELEFYVNPKPQTINVDGENLSCTVIQESTLDLRFYFYEDRMVQMRNDDQDLTFTLIN